MGCERTPGKAERLRADHQGALGDPVRAGSGGDHSVTLAWPGLEPQSKGQNLKSTSRQGARYHRRYVMQAERVVFQ